MADGQSRFDLDVARANDVYMHLHGTPEQKSRALIDAVKTGRLMADPSRIVWERPEGGGKELAVGVEDGQGGRLEWPPKRDIEVFADQAKRTLAINAKEREAVGPGTRAAAGLQFDDPARRRVIETMEGGQVIDTPEGEVVVREGEGPQLVDKPFFETGQGVGGFLREMVSDTMDLAGEGLEITVDALSQYMLGKGKAPTRVLGGAGAGGLGVAARGLAANVVPGGGEDIGTTAKRGLAAAATGGVAEGLTSGATEIRRQLRTRIPGRALTKNADNIPLDAIEETAGRFGVNIPPAAMTMDADALQLTEVLRGSPGVKETLVKNTVDSAVNSSRTTHKIVDAALGGRVPPGVAAEKVTTALKAYDRRADGLRKKVFRKNMEKAKELVGDRKIFKLDNVESALRRMERDGVGGLEGLRRMLSPFKKPVAKPPRADGKLVWDPAGVTLGPKMVAKPKAADEGVASVEQMQNLLAKLGNPKHPAFPSDRSHAHFVHGRIRKALMKDFEAAENVASVATQDARAAGFLRSGRESYRAMSDVIRNEKSRVAAKLAKAADTKDLSLVPKRLLREEVSTENLTLMAKALNKQGGEGRIALEQLRRAMMDEILKAGRAEGSGLVGKRLDVIAKQGGEEIFDPTRIARSMRGVQGKNRETMRILSEAAGDSKFMKEYDEILDIMERQNLLKAVDTQSSTANRQMSEGFFRAIAEAASSPKKAGEEFLTQRSKKHLAALMLTPKGRRILRGLEKEDPNNVIRAISTQSQNIAGILLRDSWIREDEDTPFAPAQWFKEDKQENDQ